MITLTLKCRERDDHRPDGDDTDRLRISSSWIVNAFSRSSPQGGGTRLFRFFIKFSGMEVLPALPSKRPNGERSKIALASKVQPRTEPALDSIHGRSTMRAPANASRGSRQRYTLSRDPHPTNAFLTPAKRTIGSIS
jgi:hypothetical protein